MKLFFILCSAVLSLFFIPSMALAKPFSERIIEKEIILQVERGHRPVLDIDLDLQRFDASDVDPDSEFLIATIQDSTPRSVAIAALQHLPRVISAEPNGTMELFATPNDAAFSSQWHHTASTGANTTGAWDTQTGSSSVVVAVIDTGIDTDHPDLVNALWSNSDEIAGNGIDDDSNGKVDDTMGWNYVEDTNDPNPIPNGIDDDGQYGVDTVVNHGTHVAGIIGATGNNTTGVSGVAWDASLMILKIYDDEGTSVSYPEIGSAITYARNNGANIINMSFGGRTNSTFIQTAINNAVEAGLVLVAAAGNDTLDMNTTPIYPACYTGVLGVTATEENHTTASYSNFGTNCADVAAPGSDVYSTLYTNNPTYGFTSDYGSLSGTSMASPVVAGIAALVLSQNNTLNSTAVRNVITAAVDDIGLGASYGSGLVNAEKAVAAASCVQEDDSVLALTTYYADADGDTLGDANTLSYSCSGAPTGHVSNNTDTNDNDADNDGVITASDCNDADSTISANQTYYADVDGDGFGDAASSVSVCSLTAPAGYVNNSSDTNDDPITSETHPVYGAYDASDPDVYSEAIQEVKGKEAGVITVKYADDTVYAFSVFGSGNEKNVIVERYPKSSYLIALQPGGKKIALINPFTGKKIFTKTLADDPFEKVAMFITVIDDTRYTIIVAQRTTAVKVSVLKVLPKKTEIKLQHKTMLKEDYVKNIVPKKSTIKDATLQLRNKEGKIKERIEIVL